MEGKGGKQVEREAAQPEKLVKKPTGVLELSKDLDRLHLSGCGKFDREGECVCGRLL